mgnify:CR=1 FL=1
MHLIQEVGTLRQMVANGADNGQNKRWQEDVLQEVKEPLKKRWEIPAGKTRNVENPAAGKSVNLNCSKDNQMARTTVGMTIKSEATPLKKRSCHWYCRCAVYTPSPTPIKMDKMVAKVRS